MFRKMRRGKQALTQAQVAQILASCTSGTLALLGEEGYPYAVPLSYAYEEGKIYFHCALEGHKIDAVKNCEKASFCIIAQDKISPEEFVTHYKSVIAFGKIRVVTEDAIRRKALELLAQKYSPIGEEKVNREIASFWNTVCILELQIEHITGKAAKQILENK